MKAILHSEGGSGDLASKYGFFLAKCSDVTQIKQESSCAKLEYLDG